MGNKINPHYLQGLGIKGLCEVSEPSSPTKKKPKKSNNSVREYPVSVKEVEEEEEEILEKKKDTIIKRRRKLTI